MDAGLVVYNLLSSSEIVTNAIYPEVVPQNVTFTDGVAVITYTVFNTDVVQSKSLINDTDFQEVQVSIFHQNKFKLITQVMAVVEALQGQSGSFTVSGTAINYKNIRVTNKEDVGFVEESEVYMYALDFKIQMIA